MKSPRLTVDIVLIENNSVLLVKRKYEPYKGYWAIPGGFVEYGEKVESTGVREMKEETGLNVEIGRLVGVYSDPSRDPRGHVVSVVFLGRRTGGDLKAGTDSREVKFFHLGNLPELAFDHKKILDDVSGSRAND